jgi:hypothetical protein
MNLPLLLVLSALVAGAQPPAAAPQPPIAGVWKLNPEKSGASVPPGYLEIRQYAMRPDGYLVGLLIQGAPQGPFHYLQFTAKSDGKDYPEYSDPIVSAMIANGTPTPRTYAETKDDEYTTDWTDKVNGRVTGHGKKIVSKDGRTLTITVDGSSQLRVYDRQ